MESIQQVIDRFDFQGKTADCRAFGNGHINTTYIITTDLPEVSSAMCCRKSITMYFVTLTG